MRNGPYPLSVFVSRILVNRALRFFYKGLGDGTRTPLGLLNSNWNVCYETNPCWVYKLKSEELNKVSPSNICNTYDLLAYKLLTCLTKIINGKENIAQEIGRIVYFFKYRYFFTYSSKRRYPLLLCRTL